MKKQYLDNSVILDINSYNPRRNLPPKIANKRGEANFVGAFHRRYIKEKGSRGVGARHFAISGYGIADFIWFDSMSVYSESGNAISQEDIRKNLLESVITAFEMKLTDWKKAIQQAYRYSYFADAAIVVLPSERKAVVLPRIDLFKQMDIGLWFFDKKNDAITKAFMPSRNSPRNAIAKEKAVDLLVRKVYLRSLSKNANSIL